MYSELQIEKMREMLDLLKRVEKLRIEAGFPVTASGFELGLQLSAAIRHLSAAIQKYDDRADATTV
jgi:hypothetical protein